MRKPQDNTLDTEKLTKTDRRFLKEYSIRPEVAKWWNYRLNAGKGTEAAYSAVMALIILPCFDVVDSSSMGVIIYKRKGKLLYSCYPDGEEIDEPLDLTPYLNTAKDKTDYLAVDIMIGINTDNKMRTGVEFIPKALSPEGRKLVKITMLTELFCTYAHVETEDQFDCALYPILFYGIDFYTAASINYMRSGVYPEYMQGWELANVPHLVHGTWMYMKPGKYAELVHENIGTGSPIDAAYEGGLQATLKPF